MLSLEGMTANVSWLPHLNKLKSDEDNYLYLDFGSIRTSIPLVSSLFGIYYSVAFQFNDITIKSFIDAVTRKSKSIDLTDHDTDKQRKIRINVSGACKNITINDLIHMINLVPNKIVEIIIDGCDISKMIELAKARGQISKMADGSENFDGYTPSGLPLLFACIEREPEN